MGETADKKESFQPKILVFSTNNISDPGIDFAGSSHMHYPTTVDVVTVPCSSGIKPKWIMHAFEKGFDGVFIAADGTDCPYSPACPDRTAKLVGRTQESLKEKGIDPARLKMAAICSVCAESFSNHMKNFHEALIGLGGIKQ